MLTSQRLAARSLLLSAALFVVSSDASAWTSVSGIAYNDQLTSYSVTAKDWWDEDVGGDCAYWEYDEEWEEWYCGQWLMWENYASVWGVLWKPSGGAYSAGYLEDRWWAQFQVGWFTPPETGTWTETGDHWIVQQLYQEEWWGWHTSARTRAYLGYTAVQANVPPPPGPCTPALQGSLLYPSIRIHRSPAMAWICGHGEGCGD